MIIDQLTNGFKYFESSLFKKAFDYLVSCNFDTMNNGKLDIFGDDLFAIVSRNGDGKNNSKLEVHRKYIDIHYVVSGYDTIGWKFLQECKYPINDFDEKNDYQLFDDLDFNLIQLKASQFCVLFPNEAHAPLIETVGLNKIVLKLKIDSL